MNDTHENHIVSEFTLWNHRIMMDFELKHFICIRRPLHLRTFWIFDTQVASISGNLQRYIEENFIATRQEMTFKVKYAASEHVSEGGNW